MQPIPVHEFSHNTSFVKFYFLNNEFYVDLSTVVNILNRPTDWVLSDATSYISVEQALRLFGEFGINNNFADELVKTKQSLIRKGASSQLLQPQSLLMLNIDGERFLQVNDLDDLEDPHIHLVDQWECSHMAAAWVMYVKPADERRVDSALSKFDVLQCVLREKAKGSLEWNSWDYHITLPSADALRTGVGKDNFERFIAFLESYNPNVNL